MKYISTRGAYGAPGSELNYSDVLISGLASDGGLMLPVAYPNIPAAQLSAWRGLSYPDLAFEILSLFATDIDPSALRRLVNAAYTEAVFGSKDITPLKHLEGNLHLLQLSNGPTLAFKDIAMQFLGHAFEYVLNARGERLTILGATSGDTGSAAEYAMRGKAGIEVFMMSPAGRMSAFQRAQMFSLQEPNIHNIAVEGVFDDCQDIVKSVSSDLAFKKRYSLGTVNSINWGRIAAQIVYYFKGYFAATKSNEEKVSFCVPSGNFGNILAGHIAREMGCPIDTLLLATNENDVLDEFFKTGVYRPRGSAQTHETSSPSMDISKASNFERFVFDLVGRDAIKLAALWKTLERDGFFDMSATSEFLNLRRRYGFVSGRSTHQNRLDTIRSVYANTNTLIDTHTADGVTVARDYLAKSRETAPQTTMLVLETALPVKFAATIEEAVGFSPPLTAGQSNMMDLPQRFESVQRDAYAVRALIESVVPAA
jgi:threonine synthase